MVDGAELEEVPVTRSRFIALAAVLACAAAMFLTVRVGARYALVDKNEEVVQRVKTYYVSFEKQDYGHVWDHFGARMREQYPSREEYKERMGKSYESFKVVAFPTPQDVSWEDSGKGDLRRKLAKVATNLQIKTKVATQTLSVRRTTFWNLETPADGRGEAQWVVVFQEDAEGPKQTSASER